VSRTGESRDAPSLTTATGPLSSAASATPPSPSSRDSSCILGRSLGIDLFTSKSYGTSEPLPYTFPWLSSFFHGQLIHQSVPNNTEPPTSQSNNIRSAPPPRPSPRDPPQKWINLASLVGWGHRRISDNLIFFFPCLFFNKIKEKRKIIFFYTNSETIFSCFYVILMYMLNRKYTCAYYFLGFDMPRREAKPSPESSYYSRITRLPSRTWRGHARPQRKWRGEISWIRTSPRLLHNYLMR